MTLRRETGTYSRIAMIQEILQCKLGLRELFPEDPTHGRYTGEVVILHRRQFPEGRVNRFGRERRGIVGVIRVYTISQSPFRPGL
jgi:hypothetical protein